MTIDKRINFRGGGKGDTYQGGSGAPGSAESSGKGKSKGTGGSKGNLGGGGGGQESDDRQYSPPTAPTYNSSNINQKPVTGNDYRRSQNEFINNFNQNEASRFEPTFFNRNYNPTTLDQFGSSNQPRNYGNAAMGGILSLITGNPLASLAYRGYNFLKDKVPQFNQEVRPTPQIFEFDPTNFNTKNVATVNSFDEIDNQVAELTDKQKAFINNQKAAIELGAQTPQDIYTKITNPDYPIYDSGIFGYGEQEPTSVEEYNNYLQSIGINQRIV